MRFKFIFGRINTVLNFMSPAVQAAWSPSGPSEIQTIAICAGSGDSVLGGVKADLFLTGEMSHHEILAANASGTHVFCCESQPFSFAC